MDVSIPTLPTYLFEPNLKGLLSFVLAVALPTLAALLMKRSWLASIKGVVLLAIAAVKTIVESLVAGGGSFDGFVELVYTVGLNFGVAVVAYFGLLRGTELQQRALDSGVKDPVVYVTSDKTGRSYDINGNVIDEGPPL